MSYDGEGHPTGCTCARCVKAPTHRGLPAFTPTTRPVENQQTVEALALAAELQEALDDPQRGEWGGYPWEHLGDAEKDVRVLLSALRDLVAQAELAADMGRALRRHQAMGYAPGEDVQMRRELEDLLARLDGAR